MTDVVLRPPTAADLADIADCWSISFGDSLALAWEIIAAGDLLHTAMAAVCAGRVRSVMFAFPELRFGGGVKAAYLYALCTAPEYRGHGLGRAVCDALAQRCFALGVEVACLAPADAGLERWYCRTLGFSPVQRVQAVPLECAAEAAWAVPVSAAEYAALRCAAGAVPALSDRLLAAQAAILQYTGGAFVRMASLGALACAEPRGDTLLVRELLCPAGAERAAAAALGARWPGLSLRLCRPASEGGRVLLGRACSGAPLPQLNGLFSFPLE